MTAGLTFEKIYMSIGLNGREMNGEQQVDISNVISLLNVSHEMTAELTFENFYRLQGPSKGW